MADREFHVELKLRIDWSELDYFEHVNNVTFFKYIQAARINYWDTLEYETLNRKTKLGPMTVSVKCDFKKQLYYPGHVTIYSRVEYIKNTSFCLHHRLVDDEGDVAAEGTGILVLYDFHKHEKVTIPDDLRAKIEDLEKRRLP